MGIEIQPEYVALVDENGRPLATDATAPVEREPGKDALSTKLITAWGDSPPVDRLVY